MWAQISIILLAQYNLKRTSNTKLMEVSRNEKVVDLFFQHCIRRIIQQSQGQLLFFIARQIALVISILLDYFLLSQNHQYNQQMFHLFLGLTISYNTLEMIKAIYFHYTQVTNSEKLLNIATSLNHSLVISDLQAIHQVHFEDTISIETDKITNLRFNNQFYDFQNRQKNEDVSGQHKELRQNFGHKTIQKTLQNNLIFQKITKFILNTASLSIFIFGTMIALFLPISQIQHSLLQLFIVTIVLQKPKVYATLLAFIIAPILLFFLSFYIYFTKTQKKAKLPKPVFATVKTIQKCSQCSICFQDYSMNEQIIILPCSEMHVFHHNCIKGWSKIKPSCPICRYEIC